MPGKRELKKETKAKKYWLIPTILVAALAAGGVGVCAAASASDEIAPNTVVAGVDVGGMTRQEAVRAIEPALQKLREGSGVHITLGDGEEVAYLTYDELGATFDADALADAAYAESHTGSFFGDGRNLVSAWLGRTHVVTPEPDDGWQKKAATLLADVSGLSPEDFSYETDDTTLTMIKARDGRDVDEFTLAARLGNAEADASGARSVDLPYTVIAADQGDLKKLSEELGGQAANATYDAATDTILPERSAFNFDVSQAQMLLDAAAPGARVTVPATAEEPEVTAAELEQVLFRDVLGTYTTRVGGAAGRKANVKLTAQRVNGFVMNSGETFNYYALCGPFSKSNGYQSAPGYLQGKTVEMDGGGACQCSSTTYAAALLANLEIIARTAHGFASDYIGLGLDATVSGGGPEFIFRNNTPYPVKVEAIYSSDNRLTVNILGTKTDDTYVKMRSVTLSTTPYEEQTIVSNELAPGERKVEQTPYTGYVVDTYREIYDGNDRLISSAFEAHSTYKARNRIILVGPDAEAVDAEVPIETPAGTPAESTPAETEAPYTGPGVDLAPIDDQIDQLTPESGDTEAAGV